jgi:hypothetical protein
MSLGASMTSSASAPKAALLRNGGGGSFRRRARDAIALFSVVVFVAPAAFAVYINVASKNFVVLQPWMENILTAISIRPDFSANIASVLTSAIPALFVASCYKTKSGEELSAIGVAAVIIFAFGLFISGIGVFLYSGDPLHIYVFHHTSYTRLSSACQMAVQGSLVYLFLLLGISIGK